LAVRRGSNPGEDSTAVNRRRVFLPATPGASSRDLCRDPPGIAARVLQATAPVGITVVVQGRLNRNASRFERALVGCVDVFDVNM